MIAPTQAPPRARPWLEAALLATTLVVLAAHADLVAGLARAGVGWTDGDLAYGVTTDTLVEPQASGLARALGAVEVLAVLVGPLVVLGAALHAASGLRWARHQPLPRWELATCLTTLVAASALLVLLLAWGQELWVWLLD
ncbi:hypothetical protein [Quadrisphaera sp. KR29]|uniref:hypothetical protein n=1 Tax=Quadrisphaera sp. KR29 TaxID=3461391 RepID=UPI0040440D80